MSFKAMCISIVLFNKLFLFSSVFASQIIELRDGNGQSISMEPSTLAIDWNGMTINQPILKVDNKTQYVKRLQQLSDRHVQWILLPSNIKVDVEFNKKLNLTFSLIDDGNIKRNKPLNLEWFNLASEEAQVLYLPFNEGMRIPVDNRQWIQYLMNSHDATNTTHDLKMPFWTAKVGGVFVSWQLVTATNNKLFFFNNSEKLGMQSSHYFTVLNSSEAFTVSISLGEHMLDGAKQYRNWRINNKLSKPLPIKLKNNGDIIKLVGASHVYLFGRDGISKEDVKDWKGLTKWLLAQTSIKLDQTTRGEFEQLTSGRGWISQYHKQTIVNTINQSLDELYATPRPKMTNNAIEAQFQAAQHKKVWLLNNAGNYLKDVRSWGQAISKDMLETFKSAGLSRLWLGFDNWMPAFYQPEVIENAKSAGYLVGTYDSYNTALPEDVNDTWLTAQLPERMRKNCAIELADGTKKSWF